MASPTIATGSAGSPPAGHAAAADSSSPSRSQISTLAAPTPSAMTRAVRGRMSSAA
jgi:hypothetical protein